jgi:hypothetical protein
VASERRLRIVTTLLALALLGIAQWFFGNLYEAVVTAPNWRVGFEYEAMTGRSQHADRAIWYYAPSTWVSIILLWAAASLGSRPVPGARAWLAMASVFSLAAVVLSIYIITRLNSRLFLNGPAQEIDSVRPLVERWQLLNGVRVFIVGLALIATAGALRLVYRESLLQRFDPEKGGSSSSSPPRGASSGPATAPGVEPR